MSGLLDAEPTQPDPDRDGRIPYFEPPADEPNPTEGVDNGDR